MDQQKSDPTGAFRGGSAGLAQDDRSETDEPATETTGDDGVERAQVTEGLAATSEIADPDAQANAERQGDGPPLPS